MKYYFILSSTSALAIVITYVLSIKPSLSEYHTVGSTKLHLSTTQTIGAFIWEATLADVLQFSRSLGTTRILLDVRPFADYQNGHVPGAISIQTDDIQNATDIIKRNRDIKTVIIYCANSNCSSAALSASWMGEMFDIRSIGVYSPGYQEWVSCGLPVDQL